MKILFLTYDLPYPLNSGGKIRAYYLIKNLAKSHEITLFSYYRGEDQRKYLPEIAKFCPKIFLFKRRPAWSWQNLLYSLNPKLPFPAATYYSSELAKTLRKELTSSHYDLVHFESFYPSLYLQLVKKLGIKTVMGNENVEYQVYRRYAQQKPPVLRQLLELEVFRMKFFEEKLWRLADVNISPSVADSQAIEKITKKTCPVIPNGVDLVTFGLPSDKKPGQNLIFIGTLTYQANNDAIKFFLSEIYPLVKKQVPEVKFILVSWYKPTWLKKYLQDTSLKFIQDKETTAARFYQQADILVAPIRVAGGTRIKILEAMAAGLPVVTTAMGIEGIEAEDKKEIVVADKPKDFADQVVKLLNNPRRRQELGLAGRKLVAEKYDWSKISEKLNIIYEKIA